MTTDAFRMWFIALGAVILAALPLSLGLFIVGRRSPTARAGEAERLVEAASTETDPARRSALLATAASRVEPLLGRSANERHRDAAFVLGYVRFEQERYAEAAKWLQEGLRRPLKRELRRHGYTWLASSAAAAGDHQLAHEALERLGALRQSEAQERRARHFAARLEAVLRARSGEFEKADAHLREAESYHRSRRERIATREATALVHHYRGESLAAAALLTSAIDERRNDGRSPGQLEELARSWCYLSEVLFRLADRDGARLAAAHAIDAVPAHRPALRARIDLAAARAGGQDLDAAQAAAAALGDRVLLARIGGARASRNEPGTSIRRCAAALIAVGEVVEATWLVATEDVAASDAS